MKSKQILIPVGICASAPTFARRARARCGIHLHTWVYQVYTRALVRRTTRCQGIRHQPPRVPFCMSCGEAWNATCAGCFRGHRRNRDGLTLGCMYLSTVCSAIWPTAALSCLTNQSHSHGAHRVLESRRFFGHNPTEKGQTSLSHGDGVDRHHAKDTVWVGSVAGVTWSGK